MKRFVAGLAIAGSLAAGAVGLAVVNPMGVAGAITAQATGGNDQGQQAGRHGIRNRLLREATKRLADKLGMTPKDLVTELRSGKSISQVAQEKGVDPGQLKDEIVQAIDTRIDRAVTNGKITEDKADEMKAKVPDRVDKLMDRVWGQGHQGQGQQDRQQGSGGN